MKTIMKNWRIDDWTATSKNKNPMSKEEIKEAVKYLRKNNYPRPEDCKMQECQGYRPSCNLGTCYVAVRLCGDF